MKKIFKSQSLAAGLAMFSMFFGAGNVIFPIALGQFAGNKILFAIGGLIVTAACVPIAGVVAMILFDGSYKQFFGRMGKIPGLILATAIISLIGPFGSTPRCIALSYATLKGTLIDISPILFGAISCGIIFLCTIRKTHLLNLLGWVLTPFLLISLLSIIVLGFIAEPNMHTTSISGGKLFAHGLIEGYNTMDLLASFFFSSTIITILKMKMKDKADPKSFVPIAYKASFVGILLLSAVYVGFCYIAAFHGGDFLSIPKENLLGAITEKIAGPYASLLVCVTVALACLTTAIALILAFADFMQTEILKNKVPYEVILVGSLLITFVISTFEFKGISSFLGPILQICYPGLILLTFLNIAYSLKNFRPIKLPVFAAFILSTYFYFF